MFLCFSGAFFDYLHTKVEKIKFGMYLFLIYWLNSVKNTYHFLIKQIGMYKGDFFREFCWNFTYQIEKMHFGMYILDCHVASLLAMSRTHPRAYRVLLCKTRDLWIATPTYFFI